MLRIVALIVAIILVSTVFGCAPLAATPTAPAYSDLSFQDLKSKSESPSYDDLFRNNEQHVGQIVYYKAQVIQVLDVGQGRYQLRANVTEGTFRWSDTVFLRYSGARLLMNDIIEFVGTVVGLQTYKSVLGGPITIPDISVIRAELVTKAP